ncbi:MAG: hypothetical protein HYV07_05055 [Deltaproteobacteria bacterium]|nr:hypothetical protein [Deltaproteobacteria bacterium]
MGRSVSFFAGAAIAGWISFALPASADASPSRSTSSLCKKGEKKKKEKKKPSAETKVVNVRAIVGWYKAGIDAEEIEARADKAGYVANKRDQKKLEERHLPAELIASLGSKKKPKTDDDLPEGDDAEPAPAPVVKKPFGAPSAKVAMATDGEPGSAAPKSAAREPAKPAVKSIDVDAVIDPNQIDFDSVPPPAGVPNKWVTRSNDGSVPAAKPDPMKKVAPKAPAKRPLTATP